MTSYRIPPILVLPLGLVAALLWSGCGGAAAPVVGELPSGIPQAAEASGLVRKTPTPEVDPGRGGASSLTGKWFGKLKGFSPAEPALNSWNIDLDIQQQGSRLEAVVIMSELIPIAENIWDVHIRLDARTEGAVSNGEADLFLFQDLAVGTAGPGPVMGGAGADREIEYAEIILAGVQDGELQGELVIHWRRRHDTNNGWVQTCRLEDVAPVIQGNGGGPG